MRTEAEQASHCMCSMQAMIQEMRTGQPYAPPAGIAQPKLAAGPTTIEDLVTLTAKLCTHTQPHSLEPFPDGHACLGVMSASSHMMSCHASVASMSFMYIHAMNAQDHGYMHRDDACGTVIQ